MFWRKKTPAAKLCPSGHAMAASWDSCPYCIDDLPPSPARPDASALDGATQVLHVSALDLDKGTGEKRRAGPTVGWIVAANGEHKGEDFRLKGGKNVIGTAADCDIVLTDRKISRKHCTIRYEGGAFSISDLDSTNGTFVNDERVQKHELIDNDFLTLGDIKFKFKSVS